MIISGAQALALSLALGNEQEMMGLAITAYCGALLPQLHSRTATINAQLWPLMLLHINRLRCIIVGGIVGFWLYRGIGQAKPEGGAFA